MATMVVTPQTRPPAMAPCLDAPLLPEDLTVDFGTTVVDEEGGTDTTLSGVSITSPGMISGASKKKDGWLDE
jgi:hypothetical protein